MSRFRPGDVCVGAGFVIWPELNGMECTVLTGLLPGPFWLSKAKRFDYTPAHLVSWANGDENYVAASNLRLRKPPSFWLGDTDHLSEEDRREVVEEGNAWAQIKWEPTTGGNPFGKAAQELADLRGRWVP